MSDIHRAKPINGASLLVRPESLAEIRGHLEAAYPEEACGGLLGRVAGQRVEVLRTVPVENDRETERGRRYLVGPDDVLALEQTAEAAELEVVGYYHSHPDAPPRPSQFDREHAWPWYIYLIVSLDAGRAVAAGAWRLADDRSRFVAIPVYRSPVTCR